MMVYKVDFFGLHRVGYSVRIQGYLQAVTNLYTHRKEVRVNSQKNHRLDKWAERERSSMP